MRLRISQVRCLQRIVSLPGNWSCLSHMTLHKGWPGIDKEASEVLSTGRFSEKRSDKKSLRGIERDVRRQPMSQRMKMGSPEAREASRGLGDANLFLAGLRRCTETDKDVPGMEVFQDRLYPLSFLTLSHY